MTEIIDKAFEQATTKLKEIGERIDDLPRSVAIFLDVYSAQGVIGGITNSERLYKKSDLQYNTSRGTPGFDHCMGLCCRIQWKGFDGGNNRSILDFCKKLVG